ncbi:MAG: hypothetical protein K0S04_485 [Herbinix sp.]|jgi:hypothetical protein|nr:hypothetical protein [Herbinix sp.]
MEKFCKYNMNKGAILQEAISLLQLSHLLIQHKTKGLLRGVFITIRYKWKRI